MANLLFAFYSPATSAMTGTDLNCSTIFLWQSQTPKLSVSAKSSIHQIWENCAFLYRSCAYEAAEMAMLPNEARYHVTYHMTFSRKQHFMDCWRFFSRIIKHLLKHNFALENSWPWPLRALEGLSDVCRLFSPQCHIESLAEIPAWHKMTIRRNVWLCLR